MSHEPESIAGQSTEERLRLALRAARMGVWSWDARTGVVSWGSEVEEIFGLAPGTFGGTFEAYLALIHPEDRHALKSDLARAFETREEFVFDHRILYGGGAEVRWTRCQGRVTLDRAGAPMGMMGVSFDITALREAQSRLAIADRMASLGTLAAGVAHEINNPLAWILTNLVALRDGMKRMADPRRDLPRELLGELQAMGTILAETLEGAERVRGIVRDLRTFSRPEDDTWQPVGVVEVLDSTLSLAGNVLRHRTRVIREYRERPKVTGSAARLGQVFLNLVMNAAQAMGDGASDRNTLRVTVDADGGRAVVSVADTGEGIPPEARPHIFDPFFTTRAAGSGTGLGLSICKRIVEAHGGEIQVESERGRGTIFHVLLPLAEVPASDADLVPSPVEAAPPVPRLKLLVLDDELLVGRAIGRVLSDHEVAVFTSAREALERIAAGERWDILLCDLMMPEIGAKELRGRIEAIAPELLTRTIYMTGGALTGSAAEFLRRVPNPRLDKPFEVADIQRAMAEIVDLGPR